MIVKPVVRSVVSPVVRSVVEGGASASGPAETEILRPVSNVNELWLIFDYTNIDDVVESPTVPPDGNNAVANKNDDNEEQAWQLSSPVGSGNVSTIRLHVYGRSTGGDAQADIRLKVNGVFTESFDPGWVFSSAWAQHDFSGDWEAGGLDVEVHVDCNVVDNGEEMATNCIYVELNP